MAFRKVSYLIPSCDGCGLAWSFGDPACTEGIPPHFTTREAALAELPNSYGWQIVRRRIGRPLMACRRCSAAGVIPATAGRSWLLAVAGLIRSVVPFGPVRGGRVPGLGPDHPESMTAVLSADEEGLLAVIDAEVFPDQDTR